jgi:pyridoxal phosphate enzyme (YggS family)
MTFNHNSYLNISDFILKNSQKNVKIVAVSKNQTISSIKEAIDKGVLIFGENRVQEANIKFSALRGERKDIELHLTGPLQTNKVKAALKIFDIFQTLDRKKLVLEFLKHPEDIKKKKFFVQINIGKEDNKSGIYTDEANEFIEYCKNDAKMNISGLMCIPPENEIPDKYFGELREIAKQNDIKELSMGMSSDYERGIVSGATIVRVGTYLFGKRN